MSDEPTPAEEFEKAEDDLAQELTEETGEPVSADDDHEDSEENSDDEGDEPDTGDEADADASEVIREPGEPSDGLALRTLDLKNFSLGPTGLTVTGEPTLEEWAGIGELLRTLEHGLQWAVGDWICAGEGRFGEQASQILDHTAWSVRTAAVYRWAASRVPPENRRADLTFSHHLVIADLPPDEQRAWLEKAAAPEAAGSEMWSVQRLKREMAVATAKGTVMRYMLVVDCDDESAREKLQRKLERDGFACRCAEATRKRVLRAGKAKRAKKNGKPVVRGRKSGVRGGRRKRGRA